MNAINLFAHQSTIIAKAIADLMRITPISPSTFRLSVSTPADTRPEGDGMYAVEAPVVAALLNLAYSEVVSAACRTTRLDSIPVADRGRTNYYGNTPEDEVYDGADEPEETQETLDTALDAALDRAAVIRRYGKYIAAIKDGGAEWLNGFEVETWKPAAGLSEELTEKIQMACDMNAGLAQYIKAGQVVLTHELVNGRLPTFTDWLKAEMLRCDDEAWSQKLARVSILNLEVEPVGIDTCKNFLGEIVLGSAFRRETTRLEDAITQAANSRWRQLSAVIDREAMHSSPNERNVVKALKKAWAFLPYATQMHQSIREVKSSDDYQDWELANQIEAAKQVAQTDLRQALREKALFDIGKQADEIARIRAQAAAIRASLVEPVVTETVTSTTTTTKTRTSTAKGASKGASKGSKAKTAK